MGRKSREQLEAERAAMAADAVQAGQSAGYEFNSIQTGITPVVSQSTDDDDDFDYENPFADGAEISFISTNERIIKIPQSVKEYCEATQQVYSSVPPGHQGRMRQAGWRPLRKKTGQTEAVDGAGTPHEIWVQTKDTRDKRQAAHDKATGGEPPIHEIPQGMAYARGWTKRGRQNAPRLTDEFETKTREV
jgi:hypothetical protein